MIFPDKQTLELFRDGLKSVHNTISVLNEIKKKRKSMSNTQLPITDEMVKDFIRQEFAPVNIPYVIERWDHHRKASVSNDSLPIQETKPAPLFTTEDGKDIFDGGKYCAVDPEDFSIIPNAMGAGPYYKRFSTEAAAQLYVVMNNPVLSISEVLNIKTVAGTGELAIERLKQLVKSKLNTGGDKP